MSQVYDRRSISDCDYLLLTLSWVLMRQWAESALRHLVRRGAGLASGAAPDVVLVGEPKAVGRDDPIATGPPGFIQRHSPEIDARLNRNANAYRAALGGSAVTLSPGADIRLRGTRGKKRRSKD